MKTFDAEITDVLAAADLIYTRTQIEAALQQMAIEVADVIGSTTPVVLPVMNGALMTASNLLLSLPLDTQIDYIHASRYRGDTQGRDIVWHRKPGLDLQDRTVLIVDDILDEGDTLVAIMDYCRQQGASKILSAVLVEKIHKRKHPKAKADFVALSVEDRYVFGYGMDYKNHLRNLPAIYAVSE